MVAVMLLVMVGGCRLSGREGPISRSLVTCRQFSQQGLAAAEQGDDEQAQTLLAQAVEACPVDPEARGYYADVLWRRGEKEKAVAEAEEASRLAGEDPLVQVRLARMYIDSGQIDRARIVAERAIDLAPKLSSAWAIRGRVSRASGDAHRALADFHQAVNFSPDNQQVLMEVAESYRVLNQPRRALVVLRRLADSYPPGQEPQDVLHMTGLAHMALGRYEDAARNLEAAVRRDRPTPDLLCHLAEVEFRLGHPAAATNAARQALSLDERHRPTHELLARLQSVR